MIGRLRGAWWAARALAVTSSQLRAGGLDTVRVPAPRDVSPAAESGAAAVMVRVRPTCLRRALVRQAWLAARGSNRDVVIGVRRAGGFAAHAWLDGDPATSSEGYVELMRRPFAP